MGSLAAGSFLGAGVSLRSVRGFGARAPRGGGASTSAAPAAVWFAAKGVEAKEGEARREERSPRRVAVELWDKAQRARDAAGKAFVVKAHFGEDVVRLKLEPGMNVADLLSRLQNSIDVEPTRLRLKYKDDVGELCALVGDADLDECRAVFAHTGTMRLYAVG